MQTKKEVLVIDDNEIFSSALKTLLEYDDFKVKTCHSPVSALSLAEKRGFDIYIIDYHLPEIHGDTLTAAIRRMQPSAIIIGTSYESKERAFLSAGADTFIAKFELPAQLSVFIRQKNVRMGALTSE